MSNILRLAEGTPSELQHMHATDSFITPVYVDEKLWVVKLK